MARKKQVNAVVISHKGCERGNNEDNFFFNGDYMSCEDMDEGAWIIHKFTDELQLYAVCDGMGGAEYGERASNMTVRKMVSLLAKMSPGKDIDSMVSSFCDEASDEVYQDGVDHNAKYQGTTLAMVVLKGDIAHVFNVGDSRVYLARKEKLTQLSDDHSEVNVLRKAGLLTAEQARKHPKSNVITSYIGISPKERTKDFMYSNQVEVHDGDRLILCSDGISDMMPEDDILDISNQFSAASDAAEALSLRAMENGGKDNLTCILLDL